jgi:glycerol-3-phosphate dehydrogenase
MNAAPEGQPYDVAVIGAGVVGCAVARELAGYDLRVALVEAKSDVGDGTSKANTAILHTGFDAAPGSLESRLVRRGHALLGAHAEQSGIPLERTGALLVAWTEEEAALLPGLLAKAQANGYGRCALLDAAEVEAALPALSPGALGGLLVPDESIICPWTTTLAFATEAVARGVVLLLRHEVRGVTREAGAAVLDTSRGHVRARWVVNAAGLGSDVLDRAFGGGSFTVTPRRGELIVFDKQARPLAPVIVLPVPSSRGKGVLIAPTVYGNVMLGPTAEDLNDKGDTATTVGGLATLLDKGRRLMPRLLDEDVTATYAGLRAATEHGDYQVRIDPAAGYLCLGGIRSTGLTASMALAEHASALLAEAGLGLRPRDDLPDPPRMPPIGQRQTRPYEDGARIAADGAYGEVVCFCERTTSGEIRDALASAIPPADLDGLRRRTRATMGRCQGFACGARVESLLGGAL